MILKVILEPFMHDNEEAYIYMWRNIYIYLKLNVEHILLQPSVVLQPPTCFVCKEHTYSNWNFIYKCIDENQPHTHTGIVCGTIYIYICMFGENSIYIYIWGT